MMKYLIVILLTGILAENPVSETQKADHPVESWKVGTYDGILDGLYLDDLISAREKGIHYLELSINPLLQLGKNERTEWIQELKLNTEAAGIQVWSVHMAWSNTVDISTLNEEDRANTIETHIEVMKLLAPLNVQKYVIHPSAEPVTDEDRSERLQNSINSLKILSKEAQRHSGKIALEVMPRTLLGNTSDELLYIINEVDKGLEICFDTNHVLQESPEEFVRKAGSLITTLHVSDYDAVDERHWMPGRGVINWNQVIHELVKIGYEGPWMYEVVRRESDVPVTDIEGLVKTWELLKADYLNFIEQKD